jgi:uncharacterized membrane protein
MNKTRLILVASLALNLFLAGLVVGNLIRPGFGPMPSGPRPFSFVERVVNSVAPERREEVAKLMDEVDAVMRKGFDDRSSQFDQLREIVSQETLDEAALDKALAALPAQRLSNEKAQWRAIGALIKTVSSEDRRVLADAFFMRPGPGPGPGGNGQLQPPRP